MRNTPPGCSAAAAANSGAIDRLFRRLQFRRCFAAAWQGACVGFAIGGGVLFLAMLGSLWVFSLTLPPGPVAAGLAGCIFAGGLMGWRKAQKPPPEWARHFDRERGSEGMDAWSAWWESGSWPQPWAEVVRRRLSMTLPNAPGSPIARPKPGWREALALVVCLLLAVAWLLRGAAEREQHELRAFLDESAQAFWQELEEGGVPPSLITQWREQWARELAGTSPQKLSARWEWWSGAWREQAKLASAHPKPPLVGERANSDLAGSEPGTSGQGPTSEAKSDVEVGEAAPHTSGVPRLDFPVDATQTTTAREEGALDRSRADAGLTAAEDFSRQAADESLARGELAESLAGEAEPSLAGSQADPSARGPMQESGEGSLAMTSAPKETQSGEGSLSPSSSEEQAVASSLRVESPLPGSSGEEIWPADSGEAISLPTSTLSGMGEIISVLAAAERWDGQTEAQALLRSVSREQVGSYAVEGVSLLHRDRVRRYFLALEQAGRVAAKP